MLHGTRRGATTTDDRFTVTCYVALRLGTAVDRSNEKHKDKTNEDTHKRSNACNHNGANETITFIRAKKVTIELTEKSMIEVAETLTLEQRIKT